MFLGCLDRMEAEKLLDVTKEFRIADKATSIQLFSPVGAPLATTEYVVYASSPQHQQYCQILRKSIQFACGVLGLSGEQSVYKGRLPSLGGQCDI